jgi:hypothetical protein
MKHKFINSLYILATVGLLILLWGVINSSSNKQAYEQDLDLKIQDNKNVYNTYTAIMRDSIQMKYDKLYSIDLHIKAQESLKKYHICKINDNPNNKEIIRFSQYRINELNWDIQKLQKEYEQVRAYNAGDVYLNQRIRIRQKIDSLNTLKKESRNKITFVDFN